MKHISDHAIFDYEVSIYQDASGYAVDIKKDDDVGEVIEGSCDIETLNECKLIALQTVTKLIGKA